MLATSTVTTLVQATISSSKDYIVTSWQVSLSSCPFFLNISPSVIHLKQKLYLATLLKTLQWLPILPAFLEHINMLPP